MHISQRFFHLIAVVLSLAFISWMGCSNSPNLYSFGGNSNGTDGGDLVNQSWVLLDMDGQPIGNIFWSATGTGGVTREVSTGSPLGLTDGDGDTCPDPDASTPRTADQSADEEGCSSAQGEIEVSCSTDFTLYIDDGDGHISSMEISCSGESGEGSGEITVNDYSTEVDAIFIWDAGQDFAANLGNREATTAICAASAPARTTSKVVAFLSYTGDALIDFPTNHGLDPHLTVMAPNGANIAGDWNDLFDADDWIHSLSGAGVTDAEFWTGTYLQGYSIANNCEEWTNDTDTPTGLTIGLTGYVGNPDSVDSGGYGQYGAACSSQKRLLCIGEADYDDDGH